MDGGLYLVALAFGFAIGSFLNVCIYRIPARMSLAHPPSSCPRCKAPIKPVDNIPILSFILLGGKCRSCGASISWRYPLVEALTGLAFALIYGKYGLSASSVAAAFFVSVLIVVSFVDLDTERIPNKIILPSMAVGALLAIPGFFGYEIVPLVGRGPLQPAIGFLGAGGFLLAIALIAPVFFKKDAMGGGDVKLAAFAGLFLGGYAMVALFLSFLVGGIVGAIALMLGIRKKGETIPFGPFIALGSVAAMAVGPQIWNAYLRAAGLS